VSFFKKGVVTIQGGTLVTRDESGRIVNRAKHQPRDVPRAVNWRKQARDLTDNGLDMLRVLINVANGAPCRPTLPDGSEGEWLVPTIAERRAAAKDVWEFIHGKAVAQTEVMQATKEAEDTAQYEALTDEQLRDAVRPFLERVDPAVLPEGGEAE